MHFDFRPLFRITFAELSRKYPIHRPRPSAGGALKEKQRPGALVFGSRKASLLVTFGNLAADTRILWCPSPAGPRAGSGWQPFTYNDYNTQLSRNFREIKFYFRELEKKNFREGFQHNMHGFRN